MNEMLFFALLPLPYSSLVLRFLDIMFVGRDLLFLLPFQDAIVGPNYKRSTCIPSRKVYIFSVEECIPVY